MACLNAKSPSLDHDAVRLGWVLVFSSEWLRWPDEEGAIVLSRAKIERSGPPPRRPPGPPRYQHQSPSRGSRTRGKATLLPPMTAPTSAPLRYTQPLRCDLRSILHHARPDDRTGGANDHACGCGIVGLDGISGGRVGGKPAGSLGGGILLGAGEGTPTGSGPGVSVGRGGWFGAGLGSAGVGSG